MGNHFHLLLEVPDKEAALVGWSEEDLVKRLGTLSPETHTRRVLSDVKMWRENGNAEGVAKVAESVRARLFDLSAFMKEFKHRFSMWFNKRHGRKGALWEERFKSVLVEGEGGTSPDGLGGLLAVAAYIDLNPVRAGLVDDPKDYRWCSYAAAAAGDGSERGGIAQCVKESRKASWRNAARASTGRAGDGQWHDEAPPRLCPRADPIRCWGREGNCRSRICFAVAPKVWLWGARPS
jgi:hypothetical protein